MTPATPPRMSHGTSPGTGTSPYRQSPLSSTHVSAGASPGFSARIHYDAIEITESCLFKLSKEIPTDKIESLGFQLGFKHAEIFRFKATNKQGPLITCEGTHCMLQEWFQNTTKSETVSILSKALIEADLKRLEEQYLHPSVTE